MHDPVYIGSDPELFLQSDNGKFISSIGKIGGSKDKPLSIGNGCALQEDNVAVEFNTPPADSLEMFLRVINFNLDQLTNRAKDLGLKLAIVPSAEFEVDQLQEPAAKVFGCDPDFNAWKGGVNPPPHARNPRLRSAGGHIHVGSNLPSIPLVKAMDLFLGVPSVILDPDTRRRELYGKAGAHRVKPYGVEYRVLSNFWIKTDELKKWAYQQTLTAVNYVDDKLKELHGAGDIQELEDLGEAIQYCINYSDKTIANDIVKAYGIRLAANH